MSSVHTSTNSQDASKRQDGELPGWEAALRLRSVSSMGHIFKQFDILETFVMRSRVDGIREAYRRTYDETVKCYAAAIERITELETQISEMEQTAKAEISTNAANKKSQEPKKMIPGRKPKLLTEAEAAKAVRMRNAGMTYQKIASELGVSERTIRREIKEKTRA